MFRPLFLTSLLTVAAACSTSTGFEEEVVLTEPLVAEAAPTESARTSAIIKPLPLPVPPRPNRAARRGVITAGDIDDTLNLAAFQRYVSTASRQHKLPRANLAKPVRVQLVGPDGRPAPGARVTLRNPGARDPFWSGYSGVDGMLTVFPALHGAGRVREVEMRAFNAAGQQMSQRISAAAPREKVFLPEGSSWQPDFLDLAIVMDTTGSMGDELAWITKELKGIVSQAKRAAPGLDVRYGLVVYRDRGDAYVVRNFGFTTSQAQMLRWLRAQEAAGGGDYPEAAAAALKAGASLNWRRGNGERLMFHIADAPAHTRDARAYLEAARDATRKGIQIFGLGASGVGPESEFLMRQAAAQSQGRYLFLTDDSGVGHAHAEPTISCYRVTRLTNLMKRVLQSELSGKRIEASSGQVIRTVGTYRNGRCLN